MYFSLGCFASFLSGLLGIGGGLIIVPGLVFIFTKMHIVDPSQLMHMVVGTSLASSIVNLVSSTMAHQHHRAVLWPVFFSVAPGAMIGAMFLGPGLILIIESHYLKILFGVFCLVVSTHMLLSKKSAQAHDEVLVLPRKWKLFLGGLFSAGLSTLLGIAGGIMIGTLLQYCRLAMRNVVATSAPICLSIAVTGTAGLMVAGFHQTGLPAYSTGFIYWPALIGIVLPSLIVVPIGARIAHKLPAVKLKKIFALLVLVIGAKMLW